MAGAPGARVTRLAASLNLQALSLAEGVRAALSVAVIIALIEYFHWPPLIEAALAALNTCMCDPGGPIRRRVPVLLGYTLLSALVVAGFTVARGFGIAVALPLGVFGLFCATFVRIYGEMPQLVGVLLGVMVILSLDRGADVTQAGLLALLCVAGGLWATVLTMVIWRIYPDRPARRALADVYRALSEIAGGLRDLLVASEMRGRCGTRMPRRGSVARARRSRPPLRRWRRPPSARCAARAARRRDQQPRGVDRRALIEPVQRHRARPLQAAHADRRRIASLRRSCIGDHARSEQCDRDAAPAWRPGDDWIARSRCIAGGRRPRLEPRPATGDRVLVPASPPDRTDRRGVGAAALG